MCHQIFEETFVNCFLLTPAVYFSYSVCLPIFSVSDEEPDLGIFGGRTQKGEIWGSSLAANYDSANNTQKEGVS